MAVAVDRPSTLCASCGEEFVSLSPTAPRIYCYDCRPVGRAAPAKPRVPLLELDAEPFTVEHFVGWAAELTLDNGERWVVEDFFLAFLEDFFSGFAESWLLVPEGNSKTTSMAGLGLYHCEFTSFGQALWAASSRDQAMLGYDQAEGFVVRSPRLSAVFKLHPGLKRIVHSGMRSRLQIFAADDRTGDGVIPTLGLLDELHRHKNMKLYRTWTGKLSKRGGQLAAFSTAGEPGGEFEETRERIRQMADEVVRDGCFARAASKRVVMHEWAVPEDGDVEDMRVVKAANPFSLISEESLLEKFETPTMTLAHWRRFACNLPTREEFAAITEKEWFDAQTDEEIPEGQPVWVGLDLGWKFDTTAIVPLWVRDETCRLLGPASVLVPPRDGTSLDPDRVKRELVLVHERNPIHTVVMDMSDGMSEAAWIEDELGATVVERDQKNAAAVQDYELFMDALRNGWLFHSPSAELTRHALNAVAKVLPHGDARFARTARGQSPTLQDRRVIDALVAAAMVHAVASLTAPTQVWVMA